MIVAARSKARRMNTGIVGANRTRGMDVCVYSVLMLPCVCSGLATDDPICKIHSFRLILNGNKPEGLIRQGRRRRRSIFMKGFSYSVQQSWTGHGSFSAVESFQGTHVTHLSQPLVSPVAMCTTNDSWKGALYIVVAAWNWNGAEYFIYLIS
jgi:hypothetical protein